MRSYAIGDIHGHLDKLRLAHDRVAADRAAVGDTTAPLIHIGDLIDRGPDSAGVITFLQAAQAADPRIVVLKGNHDRLFERYLEPVPRGDPCLRPDLGYLSPSMGGRATLASYGVDLSGPDRALHAAARNAVPEAHRAFLAALPVHHRHGACLFAHAGIRPGLPFDQQSEDDLLWIRHAFLDDPREHGALIVHGHTPVDRATHYGNRLNIDSGAGHGRALSAVVIEDRRAWLLTDDGRVPL